MPDNLFPTPDQAPPADPTVPDMPPSVPEHAIRPDANGAPPVTSLHITGKPEAQSPQMPAPTLRDWAMYRLTQFGGLAALWVVVFVVLLIFGFKVLSAVIFGVIIAVIGSFFLRPLLPMTSPAERVRPATQPGQLQHPTDSFREIVETVVFVVVLVLMLKTFVAEAFVIPTGSMAETLFGYQKMVTCPECGHTFPVNCSSEVDPSDGKLAHVGGCTCPNCRLAIRLVPPMMPDGSRVDPTKLPPGQIIDPGALSGDRVLVSKFVYDLTNRLPDRLDVVVFKFPGDSGFPSESGPVKKHSPMNYIKRLVGLPEETIAISRGKLYVLPKGELSFDDYEKARNDPNQLATLWQFDNMHHNDEKARELFNKGKFSIIRKPPSVVPAMMRLVYDNDHQAKDLADRPEYQRWMPGEQSGWSPTKKVANGFSHDASGTDVGWLRYRHVLRGNEGKPSLITDFLGYNTWESANHPNQPGENWASDLIVECQVQVEQASGVFALELSKGQDRFQAYFDLASGNCTLKRLSIGKAQAEDLKTAATSLKGKGSYHVRFANVDDRLLLWVNGGLVFGNGVEYETNWRLAPTKQNDLERPASIGAWANVTVSKIKVFRDTYYTTARNKMPANRDVDFVATDADTFRQWEDAPVSTYYVQPEHFLCLGDNSAESSDSRIWGLVPRRLMLGKALLVYYPFERAGRIR